jgi:DNA-binding beta-propeller fold protein YncE
MIKIISFFLCTSILTTAKAQLNRYLYVAEDQGWIYIYDIDHNHQFVRKFEVPGTGEYKGISADAKRNKLYLSSYTNDQFVAVDLNTEKNSLVNSYPGLPGQSCSDSGW